MALLNPNLNADRHGIRVKGDLGNFQIVEESNNDDDSVRTSNAVTEIATNIVQATSPMYGSLSVKNSENVHVGNNTYFNGPVTIKQIVQSIPTKCGVVNDSYTQSDEDCTVIQKEENKSVEPDTKKFLLWHKLTFYVIFVIVLGAICTVLSIILSNNRNNDHSSPNSNEKEGTTKDTRVMGSCYSELSLTVILTLLMMLTLISILSSLLINKNLICEFIFSKRKLDNYNYCRYFEGDNKGDPLLIAPNHLRIVSRTDWLAQPVEDKLEALKLPAPWVIITHTATENCTTQSACVLRVRLVQMFHIESRNWSDIGYNFLVGGDGSAYLGRGWEYVGAHTLGYNRYSIGIAFIGTFTNEPPPKKQLEACQRLIRKGVELGKIAKDYKLFAHRQLASTRSPGDKLFNILKEWPHFVKDDTHIPELVPKR